MRGLPIRRVKHIFGPQLVRYYYDLRNCCLSTISSKPAGPRHFFKYYTNFSKFESTTSNAGIRGPCSPSCSLKDSLESFDVFVPSSVVSCHGFSTVGDATLGGVGISVDGIQQWSKQRLSETTRPEQMKVIMGDLAIRLERQWNLLDQLYQLTKSLQNQSNPLANKDQDRVTLATMDNQKNSTRIQWEQSLETVNKNIHNLKVLHRDTQRTCTYFYDTLPESNLSPLLQRQLGQACKEIYARHALTIETMAEIVIDLRGIVRIMLIALEEDKTESGSTIMKQVPAIVTTFLKCRLMTQLLCDHVVDCMLHRERKPNGAISVQVNVHDLIMSAVVEARHLVEASFVTVAEDYDNDDETDMDSLVAEDPPEPPHVEVVMESPSSVTATLVRPWLQYALVELLKNSLAITMERNRRDNPQSPYWPMYIHISETSTEVILQLLDQGGGFQGHANNWFEFASRRDKWDRLDDQQSYAMVRSPIRGLGVGLSLSRLHLRQFGGDLLLKDRPDPQEWASTTSNGLVLLQSGLTVTLRLSKDWATLETAIEPRSDEF